MYVSGLPEKERAVYEGHIADLKNQVEWLRKMLDKQGK